MTVFSGCQIVLELGTKVPFKKKQQLRKVITDNGGIISFIITKKCSYLVVNDCDNVSDTYKARTALKYGVPVVLLTFINDCLEADKLLDADGYIAAGKTKAEEFGSGKIIAKSQLERPPKKKVIHLQTAKAWQWGDNKTPSYDEDTYQVAKSVVLLKKEKRKSLVVTKYCVLEIHVAPAECTPATDCPRYRVFSHSGELSDKDDSGRKEVRFSATADDALELYVQLYKYWTSSANNYSKTRQFLLPGIGSQKFRQMLCDYGMEQGSICEEVSDLLEHIWQEAVVELDQTISVSLHNIKPDQIEKALATLVELKEAVNKEDKLSVKRLSKEFYTRIPHKSTHQEPVDTKGDIVKKQDLCQLLKDMVSVNEATHWSLRSSADAKYRALRCHIVPLDKDSAEYSNVTSLLASSNSGPANVSVVNIFALHRGVEEAVFNGNLGNNRLLIHSSNVKNFVGILSRGLLKPKVVVDDFGGKRTDAGMLGQGIYFADNYTTWVKYSQTSNTKGTRMFLINEVALGKCADCYTHNTEMTAPPSGYNSVHGVQMTESIKSDFQDDEYVIYDTSQQRQRYLVEFTIPGDKVRTVVSQSEKDDDQVSLEHSTDVTEIVGLEDVKDVVDPRLSVTAGLLSSSHTSVPLKSVHVRAKLIDLAAQVVILQEYINESNDPVEVKYVFPLGEMAVVCGFEAFINGTHVVGEVLEKEEAHLEYRDAVKAGHGAYLMDQHEDLSDVFTVSIGNIPPQASVLIKITYVAELQVDGEKICFFVPSIVAPWSKQKAFDDVTQTGLTTVNVATDVPNEVTIQVAIEMPFDILSITCPTHTVRLKQTATKATVEMVKNQSLDEGFQLWIHLAQIHVPRMWVERSSNTRTQACMLTFYPEFDAVSTPQFEVVFLLDLSNSMDGQALVHAKKLLLLLLHHLPPKCSFNIVVFGTVFDELFPASQPKTKLNEQAAQQFIQETRAMMGNTDVLRPLHAYFLLGGRPATRNIFLISDGHINAEEFTLHAVSNNAPQTRLFTFAVGSTPNRHLLRRLALAGAGAYETFDEATKYKWEERVTRQLSKAAQPSLSSVSVSWQQFHCGMPVLQAPSHVSALFSGSRQVIYGLVSNCTQAELKAVIDNQEITTMVSTTELNITSGNILHQLTARAAIHDWEEGILADLRTEHEITKKNRKTMIVHLSTKYSVLTQFTSFVAVEKRDEGETFPGSCGPSLAQLVQRESVDTLEYVAWDDGQKAPVIQFEEHGITSEKDGMHAEAPEVPPEAAPEVPPEAAPETPLVPPANRTPVMLALRSTPVMGTAREEAVDFDKDDCFEIKHRVEYIESCHPQYAKQKRVTKSLKLKSPELHDNEAVDFDKDDCFEIKHRVEYIESCHPQYAKQKRVTKSLKLKSPELHDNEAVDFDKDDCFEIKLAPPEELGKPASQVFLGQELAVQVCLSKPTPQASLGQLPTQVSVVRQTIPTSQAFLELFSRELSREPQIQLKGQALGGHHDEFQLLSEDTLDEPPEQLKMPPLPPQTQLQHKLCSSQNQVTPRIWSKPRSESVKESSLIHDNCLRFGVDKQKEKKSTYRRKESVNALICQSPLYYSFGQNWTASTESKGTADYVDTLKLESTSESQSSESDSDVGIITELVQRVLRLQSPDGFWEFSDEFNALTQLHGDEVKTLLLDAGLRSLGEKVMTNVLRLVCTLNVLLWLKLVKVSMLFKERPADLYEYLRPILDEIIDDIDEHKYSKIPRSGHEFVDALRFCTRVIREHPLIFCQLQLGRTWRDVIPKVCPCVNVGIQPDVRLLCD